MKLLYGAFLTGVLVLSSGATVSGQLPAKVKPDTLALVGDNNVFAFDLYHKLSVRGGNLFLSPYSISSALAMTYGGARAQTATEMAATLHFTQPPERLHASFADLILELNNRGKPRKAQLQVANRLWGQQNYGFLPAFLKLSETYYHASLQEVDFAGHTEQARQAINTWVEAQTQRKIKNLLKPGILNVDTRLVLTNAIYFKASWRRPFNVNATVNGPFHLSTQQKITTKMMTAAIRTNFRDFGNVKVLELPYEDNELSMILLLPKTTDGLADLEKELTAAKVQQWTAELSDHLVTVTLPKFKVMAEFELNEPLKALGMVRAFDPLQADFSGLSGKKLFIAKVVHKAFIDLNETGTEAAASTAVVGQYSSEPPSGTWKADHPFVYLLRDNRTGSILFLGRLVNPKAS